MEARNILKIKSRQEFRDWLNINHKNQNECWIVAKKGKTPPNDCIWYLDSVEEALCFGWIDTTHKKINGVDMQKFTPRKKKSIWSELNKARCRRLEKLGLMTDAGRKALPINNKFEIDEDIKFAFNQNPTAWNNFIKFPELYQRVRIDTIQRDKHKDIMVFEKRLKTLIEKSEQNVMFGDWNDYGRLI